MVLLNNETVSATVYHCIQLCKKIIFEAIVGGHSIVADKCIQSPIFQIETKAICNPVTIYIKFVWGLSLTYSLILETLSWTPYSIIPTTAVRIAKIYYFQNFSGNLNLLPDSAFSDMPVLSINLVWTTHISLLPSTLLWWQINNHFLA